MVYWHISIIEKVGEGFFNDISHSEEGCGISPSKKISVSKSNVVPME